MGKRGLTLLEFLVLLGILAIVLVLAGGNLLGIRRQLSLEEAATTLSQDIQTCRTHALAKGLTCRVRFAERGYTVEEDNGTVLLSRSLPGPFSFSSPGVGAWLAFDSRTVLTTSSGFPRLAGAQAPEIRLTDGQRTLRLVLSMVGAVKMERP